MLYALHYKKKNKNFIVSVSGAQNTGKSTIVKTLVETYPDIFWTPERTYRDMIKEKGLIINQQGSFESQKSIMEFLIDQLFDVRKVTNKIVILDRSILDCHIYSKFLFINKKITLEEFKQLDDLYKGTNWILGEITNIFVRYNPDIPIINDTLRDTDVNYIKIIDYMFEEEFEKIKCEIEINHHYSKSSRIKIIMNYLEFIIKEFKAQK